MKNAFAGKPITRVLVIAAVIVLVLILFGSMYIVHQNEYGIVWQFGAVNTVRNEPGLYLKVPFVQSVSTLPKTELLYDLPISDVITGDKHSMVLDSFAGKPHQRYHLQRPEDCYLIPEAGDDYFRT